MFKCATSQVHIKKKKQMEAPLARTKSGRAQSPIGLGSNVVVMEMDDGPLERAVVRQMAEFAEVATIYYYKVKPSIINPSIESEWTESPVIAKARHAAIIVLTMMTDTATDAKLLADFGMTPDLATTDEEKIYTGNFGFLYFSRDLLDTMDAMDVGSEDDQVESMCFLQEIKKHAISKDHRDLIWREMRPEARDKGTIARLKRTAALLAHNFLYFLDKVLDIRGDPVAHTVIHESSGIDTTAPFYDRLQYVFAPLAEVQAILLLRDLEKRISEPDVTLLMFVRYGMADLFHRTPIRLIRTKRNEVQQLTPIQIFHVEKTGYVARMMEELRVAWGRMKIGSDVIDLL